ncbi:MAG: hypothetical protein AB8C84_10885, partial [Oligoflexales bacterium]
YENNDMHTNLDSLKQLIASLVANDEASNVEMTEDITRIQQVVEFTSVRLDSLDPNLVPIAAINNMSKLIANINNELNSYQKNKNPSHIQQGNNHVDSLLAQLSNILQITTPDDVNNIRESITSFRRSAAQNLRLLQSETEDQQNRVEELKKNIDSFSDEVKQQKNKLDAAITQFQQQFSEAENSRREAFSALEKDQREKSEASLKSYTTQFEDLFRKNTNTEAEFSRKLTEATQQGEQKLKESTKKLIEEIEEEKSKAEKLVHIIGNTGMVGGYQRTANQKRNAAQLWKGVTFISLSGLVGFAIYAMTLTTEDSFNWGVFSARVFVSITFGVLAAYAARQGDRNDRLEAKHRRTELELASINPYLSDLPEDKQRQIKEELSRRIFGASDIETFGVTDTPWNGSSLDIIKLLLRTIETTIKSSK